MRASHQIHLMTRRGGRGIPPHLALAELVAVFGPSLTVVDEPEAGRLRAHLDLGPDDVARLARRLGWTRAVLALTWATAGGPPVVVDERPERPWPRGWRWRDGQAVRFDEVYVADAGPPGRVAGHARRHLAVSDARAVANLAGVADGARVLDPCAGLGTLAGALAGRSLDVLAADVASEAVAAVRALGLPVLRADARALPLAEASLDAVVSEPPYRAPELLAAALPGWARLLVPGGRLALLVPAAWEASLSRDATCAGFAGGLRFRWSRHDLEVGLWLGALGPERG